MTHVIVTEDLVDADFVAKHTEGFADIVEATRETTPEWAEAIDRPKFR